MDARSQAKLPSGGETAGRHPGPGQQFLVGWSRSVGQRLPGKEEELTFAGGQLPGATGMSQMEDRKAARPHFADDKAEATWLRGHVKPVDLLHSPGAQQARESGSAFQTPANLLRRRWLICHLQCPGGRRKS